MDVVEVLTDLRRNQLALLTITLLELTGYLFPPPARLRSNDSCDYLVVGGGTAGSVIATRLVQNNYNVMLMEAGDDAPFEVTKPSLVTYLRDSHVDWNYTTEPDKHCFQCQDHKKLKIGIGKMLGGSGESNYMIYSRGNPDDFDKWYQITKDPIWQWENVLPYFIKSENVNDSAIRNSYIRCYFGSKGYIGVTRDKEAVTGEVLEGFREAGKDIITDIDGNRDGYSRGLLTINLGERQGSGTRYLSHISESHYIATAKNTLVTKILFHANKTVAGVEVITDENKRATIKVRKEIIVTSGAIKSPQLLMLSGIGPKEELKKHKIKTISDLPVGKNLQDHEAIFIPYKTNKKIVDEERPPGEYPAAVFVGYATVNKSTNLKTVPDYTVSGKIINNMQFLLQYCATAFNFHEEMCNKLYKEADNNQVIITLLAKLHARSRGQVSLRSTDPMDSPKIIHPGFSDRRDFNDFVDYIRDYKKVEKTAAFKHLGAEQIDLTGSKCAGLKKNSRKYWRCHISCMMVSLKSFSGTCALGSVVDSRLRVRGVHGLRVADASIMPTIVSGLSYNTVVMIGEKASDIIIEDAGVEYNSMEHEKIRPDQIKNMPN